MDVRDYAQANNPYLESLKKTILRFGLHQGRAVLSRPSHARLRRAYPRRSNCHDEGRPSQASNRSLKKPPKPGPPIPKLEEIDKRLDSLLDDSDVAKSLGRTTLTACSVRITSGRFSNVASSSFPSSKTTPAARNAIEQIVQEYRPHRRHHQP